MEVREFEITDLLLIKPNRFQDDRGYFMESFQVNRYAKLISKPFVQDNVSQLSQANGLQFYIPPGFAHGFQSLEDDTIFTYKCTDYYAADNEMTIRWDDPQLGISWPISPALTSPKDELGVLFETFNSPF